MQRFFLPVVLVALASACRPGDISEEDRQAAIDFDLRFAQAVLAGDVDAMTDMYTEDAIILPPGGSVIQGRDAIRQFNEAFVQAGIVQFELKDIRIRGVGDMLYMVGESTIGCEDSESTSLACRNGKYMCILREQGAGQWKKTLAIWNSRQ